MSVRSRLLALLDEVTATLGGEVDGLVLVGGSALALYSLRPGTALRPTVDVDLVADTDLPAYYALQDRLRALGFNPVLEGPLCRLRKGDLVLDIMSTDEAVLGFTNRWYREAVETAEWFSLPSGRRIRAASPLCLAASKFEAFLGRGDRDFLASHDLEDLLGLLSGDPPLRSAIQGEPRAAATFLRQNLALLAGSSDFLAAVPAHFPGDRAGQERAAELVVWLRSIAARGTGRSDEYER